MLIERRCFSIDHGTIGVLVDDVLALPRDEEVVIIFNDLIIEVQPDDTRQVVLERWNERQIAAGHCQA